MLKEIHAAGNEVVVSIDMEGGSVDRLFAANNFEFPKSLGAKEVAELNSDEVMSYYNKFAKNLADIGVNLNFAPVIDIIPQNNGCKGLVDMNRCYSSDPQKILEIAKVFVNTHRQNGLITCLKHYPGIGSCNNDTHDNVYAAEMRISFNNAFFYNLKVSHFRKGFNNVV